MRVYNAEIRKFYTTDNIKTTAIISFFTVWNAERGKLVIEIKNLQSFLLGAKKRPFEFCIAFLTRIQGRMVKANQYESV